MINEILFITITLISLSIGLLSVRFGREYILMTPVILLIISNIFAPQLLTVFGFTTSLAVPLYAAIFLCTDIIAEHFGKKKARKVIWMGISAQVVLVIFSQLIIRADVLAFSAPLRDAFQVIFAFTPRLVLGSLIAYVISQHFDVWFFHLLKKRTANKHLWLRNNLSTMTSQFIDSATIILIAFYGVLPNLWSFILSVWLLKVLVAVFDTPFIYLSRFMFRRRFIRTSIS